MAEAGYVPSIADSNQFNLNLRQETSRWRQFFTK